MSDLGDLASWRLATSLSVVDAVLLSVGLNPARVKLGDRDLSIATITRIDATGEPEEMLDPAEFIATFKAVRAAIYDNELRAITSFDAKDYPPEYEDLPDGHVFDPTEPLTSEPYYRLSLANREVNLIGINERALSSKTTLYVFEELNWHETKVTVADFKSWLEKRDYFPSFFFPDPTSDEFRNPDHPRYSPKLACAVAAWEAVETRYGNRSVKQSLERWVRENGSDFGLGYNKSGVPKAAAEEIAKVVNWQPQGGATPTASSRPPVVTESSSEIQNFRKTTPRSVSDDGTGEL